MRNDQKGNFEDVTEKWAWPAIRAAGQPLRRLQQIRCLSLLTSTGKLYTNLGNKFRDDSALLPATPKRVSNPGEAFAGWTSTGRSAGHHLFRGVQVLAAFLTRGVDGKWFEMSPRRLAWVRGARSRSGQLLDHPRCQRDGKPDFISILPAAGRLEQKRRIHRSKDTGLKLPHLPRPALAYADFLNSGKLGIFVTTNERRGALTSWQMLELLLPRKTRPESRPRFQPSTHPKSRWAAIAGLAAGPGPLHRNPGDPPLQSVSQRGLCVHDFRLAQRGKIALHVGSENGLTVWLNGKQVYDFKGKRSYVADVDAVEVEAKKGPNTVLLKVMDEGPSWRTGIRPGPMDLYPPSAVQLYQSDGQGKFQDVTAQAGDLAQLRAEAVSAVWADLDNDGLLDLLVTCKTGLVRFYRNLGDGKFRYATPNWAWSRNSRPPCGGRRLQQGRQTRPDSAGS